MPTVSNKFFVLIKIRFKKFKPNAIRYESIAFLYKHIIHPAIMNIVENHSTILISLTSRGKISVSEICIDDMISRAHLLQRNLNTNNRYKSAETYKVKELKHTGAVNFEHISM